MIINHRIFLQTNCFRCVNVMNNTTIIKTFNSDNSNIAYIKTQHMAMMAIKSWQSLLSAT